MIEMQRLCVLVNTSSKMMRKNVSICDLIGKMQEYLDGSEEYAYNRKFVIEKLKEHYGDEVIISSRRGQGISNVLTLRESADKVLGMYYQKPKDVDTELQKRDIIEAAAKILKSDIKSSRAKTFKGEYPSVEKLSLTEALSYIPESLQTFCRALFVVTDKERKIASIGQSIIQATRPPVITFDQPLFWKVSMIVKSSTDVHFEPITLLLGSFHTTMNPLGCIGVLMANSGSRANIW